MSMVRKFKSVFSLSLLANHYPPLHGLRVIAILFVIQLHVVWGAGLITGSHSSTNPASPGTPGSPYSSDNPIWRLSSAFWFGMDLFFILSGFLIGTILIINQQRDKPGSFVSFYVRRFFRIVPLYYVFLSLVAFVYFIIFDGKGGPPGYGSKLWAEYLYLTNYVSQEETLVPWAWSLAVEEHFYLVIPFFMVMLAKIKSTRTQLVLIGFGCVSNIFVRLYLWYQADHWQYFDWFQKIYIPTHARYDSLLAGIALAIVQRNYKDQIKATLAEKSWTRWGLLGLSIISFVIIIKHTGPWTEVSLFRTLAIGTLTTLIWVPLIIYLINFDSRLSRFLGHRFFLVLATLGYGTYLCHNVVGLLLVPTVWMGLIEQSHVGLSASLLIMIASTFIGSICFSYILHILVEKPALFLRDRFTEEAQDNSRASLLPTR